MKRAVPTDTLVTKGRDRFIPVYARIQDRIRTAIAYGALKPGDRLPTEKELSAEFGTTRSTVRHAIDRLVYEGLVVRHVGRGTFVAEKEVLRSPIDSRCCITFEEQVAITGHQVTYRSAALDLVPAPPRVAELFGLPPDAEVYKLERVRMITEQPVGIEIRYLPQEIGRHITGEMLTRCSVHAFVSNIIGEPIPTIVVSVTAELADSYIAKHLEISEGSAVTVRTNSHHITNGNAVICGRSIFRGDVATEYVLGRALPNSPRR